VDVLASRILLHPGDLERSLRFYGETLGLAVFRERGSGSDRGVVFFLGAGLLEVSGSSSEPPSGAVRLLLQVRDVHQAWRRLAAAGVVIEEEPKRKPWGLIEMVARDPDGLAIVIVEVPPGHASAGRRDAGVMPSAPCSVDGLRGSHPGPRTAA
jgi:catechol 2,3-dioxygenase-like lactoylglutathione lyase family enzyme